MSDRIALITGAARGIGAAIAKQLARDGLIVVINYLHSVKEANDLHQEIITAGGRAYLFPFDVSDPLATKNAIQKIAADIGLIDVLVNNAAVFFTKALVRVKQEDWDYQIKTNLSGMHYCTQSVVKSWFGKRCGSRIINLTSIGAERGATDSSTYCATKAGIIGFTKALAHELAKRKVTVNAVSPGLIDTEGVRKSGIDVEGLASQIPLGRMGNVDDVAYLVSFLASERSSFITGQVIGINGGMYM